MTKNLDDPFSVGQLVGMMVIMQFIENNQGIHKDFMDQLMKACAEKSADYLKKPVEDVYLLVEQQVKDIDNIWDKWKPFNNC